MAIYVKFYLPKPFLGGNEVRFIEQHWPLKTGKGVENIFKVGLQIFMGILEKKTVAFT